MIIVHKIINLSQINEPISTFLQSKKSLPHPNQIFIELISIHHHDIASFHLTCNSSQTLFPSHSKLSGLYQLRTQWIRQCYTYLLYLQLGCGLVLFQANWTKGHQFPFCLSNPSQFCISSLLILIDELKKMTMLYRTRGRLFQNSNQDAENLELLIFQQI